MTTFKQTKQIVVVLFLFLGVVVSCFGADRSGAIKSSDYKLKNSFFEIEINRENGGLDSLVLCDDAERMNWIEGFKTWGLPLNLAFEDMEKTEDGAVISRYRKRSLLLEVRRTMEADGLRENYRFVNTGSYDIFFPRGEYGIYTTFNDNYQDAATCLKKRCHAHIWCGGESSYVHAKKMGEYPTELALIVTKGALDAYSVERLIIPGRGQQSDDRGDFILHIEATRLGPGKVYELEWVIRPFAEGKFEETLLTVPDFCRIKFEQETVFFGEPFRLSAKLGNAVRTAKVLCDGVEIPFTVAGNEVKVEYRPEELREYNFTFIINGRASTACGLCVNQFEKLVEKRIDFIINNQQMLDPESPLYGAFLIYDNEDKRQYYNHWVYDHNASRERFAMGMLICKWLQTHKNEKAEKALLLFEKFVLREIFDTKTGVVSNTIGKDASFKRPYNAPWLMRFWGEMYKLYRKSEYLDWIERIMRDYHAKGGDTFYPNGSYFSEAIVLLRQEGRDKVAGELQALLDNHVANIIKNGTDYPPHEVRYEQTIVTPAHNILASYYDDLEAKEELPGEIEKHFKILQRFQGNQPDHRKYEIPIRHWDGFWFGKRRLYGDTLHHWSCFSAYAYVLNGKITGRKELWECARHTLRNSLGVFDPDGSAHCAGMLPYSVTMLNPDGTVAEERRRGEYNDPWANDQDWTLYLTLRVLEIDKGMTL